MLDDSVDLHIVDDAEQRLNLDGLLIVGGVSSMLIPHASPQVQHGRLVALCGPRIGCSSDYSCWQQSFGGNIGSSVSPAHH